MYAIPSFVLENMETSFNIATSLEFICQCIRLPSFKFEMRYIEIGLTAWNLCNTKLVRLFFCVRMLFSKYFLSIEENYRFAVCAILFLGFDSFRSLDGRCSISSVFATRYQSRIMTAVLKMRLTEKWMRSIVNEFVRRWSELCSVVVDYVFVVTNNIFLRK